MVRCEMNRTRRVVFTCVSGGRCSTGVRRTKGLWPALGRAIHVDRTRVRFASCARVSTVLWAASGVVLGRGSSYTEPLVVETDRTGIWGPSPSNEVNRQCCHGFFAHNPTTFAASLRASEKGCAEKSKRSILSTLVVSAGCHSPTAGYATMTAFVGDETSLSNRSARAPP